MSENIRVISLLGRFLGTQSSVSFPERSCWKKNFSGGRIGCREIFSEESKLLLPVEDPTEEAKIMESMEAFLEYTNFNHLKSKVQYIQPSKKLGLAQGHFYFLQHG